MFVWQTWTVWIFFSFSIFSSLYSREVLTSVQYEKLESKVGIRERNLELLRIIPRRGPNAFPELVSALKVPATV